MYQSVRQTLEKKRSLTREDRDQAISLLVKLNHLVSKRNNQLVKAKKEIQVERSHRWDFSEVFLFGLVMFLLGLKFGG